MNGIYSNKDILIIVGAGASCDHSKEIATCPPLGSELAATLRSVLPEFKELESKVGMNCGDDFEVWMENYAKNNTQIYSGVLWCLSKYFSGFEFIPNDSLYLELLKKMGSELLNNTAFISLNYESLLELAIKESGFAVDPGASVDKDSFNDLKVSSKIPVIKPHGSSTYRAQDTSANFGTTFSGKVTIGPGQKNVIFKNINIKKLEVASSGECCIEGTMIVNPRDVNSRLSDVSTSNHSILCAYNPEKTANLNRIFIDDIRRCAIDVASNCRKMVLLGIGYRKEDKLLNKIVEIGLSASMPNVRYIGCDDHCIGYLGTKGEYFLGDNFRGSLEGIIEFLHS